MAAPDEEREVDNYGEPWDETRVAFGSCSKSDRAQPVWERVVEGRPHAWLWGGDVIYADKSFPGLGFIRWPPPIDEVWPHYERQLAHPDYARLLALQRERGILVDGHWDDHDFAVNDGNRLYDGKNDTQRLFLDFLGVPADSPRRARGGVYSAHTVGPPGRRVKMLLLDNRFHQDPPSPEADLLGEEQWAWLERELVTENDAALTLISSGTQILSVNKVVGEGWKQFPLSRRRLFRLLARAVEEAGTAPLLLSGDVHLGEITRWHFCLGPDGRGPPVPVYDVTSSGMTHAWDEYPLLPNGFASKFYGRVLDRSSLVGDPWMKRNYGTVDVDWRTGAVSAAVRDLSGQGRVWLNTTLGALRSPAAGDAAAAAGRADCDYVDRLVYGTGGHYYHSTTLGASAFFLFAVLPLLLLVAACCCVFRRRRSGSGRKSGKAKGGGVSSVRDSTAGAAGRTDSESGGLRRRAR